MVTHINKSKFHLNKEEVNRRLAEGWLQMLREAGPELRTNLSELSKISGVPYRTVKRRFNAEFIEVNIKIISTDFLAAAERFASNPEVMAIQVVSLFRIHKTWFAIEGLRDSILLWRHLGEQLHDTMVTNWTQFPDKHTDALYALFLFRLWQIERALRQADYDIAIMTRVEKSVRSLLGSCVAGRFDAYYNL